MSHQRIKNIAELVHDVPMGRGSIGGLIGVGILAGGAVLSSRKRKKQEAERKESTKTIAASPIREEFAPNKNAGVERKCKSCGSVDTTGASVCPVCFSNFE